MMWDKKIIIWKELGLSKQIILVTLLVLHFILFWYIGIFLNSETPFWNSFVSTICFMFIVEYYFMHAIRMVAYHEGKFGFFMFVFVSIVWAISLSRVFGII